jgi:(E)-4-hydroxy-3-methylbut-2-enyl-diphosphate synthase
MERKRVLVRNIQVGGGAPVSVQSMTNTNPTDERKSLDQIKRLEEAGCDIVRMAVPDIEAAKTFARIRKKTDMPLVADIHFDYRLAIRAIEAGADKIRINPGNIGSEDKLYKVVDKAKEASIPIRVGVNSGSLEKDIINKYGKVTAEGLAESALRNLNLIESMGFNDLVVSLKASDVRMNYDAYKIVAGKTNHPIHIGITEAGSKKRGLLKSAIGIGALLLEGIGDTMRVSLTADPVEEVKLAHEILETLDLREPAYDIISCPTCGRTRIGLADLVDRIDEEMGKRSYRRGLKLAVMGCVVNGPGEAKGADYGLAGGDGKGVLFAKGRVVETVEEDKLVEAFFNMVDKFENVEQGKGK